MKKEEIKAVSIIVGTVIGAGILGIPYVIAKAGFLTGLIVLIVIGLSVLMMNLFLGEVVLRTKEDHQLPGYVNLYLGKNISFLMYISMILGIYGALIAYFIGEGEALAAIFGGNPLIYSIVFFIIVTVIVSKGIKTIASSEFLVSMITLIVTTLIILFSINRFNVNNIIDLNLPMIFLPYGVILFAFLGSVSIPEVKEELRKNKRLMKKSIILGSLIPIIIYVFFTLFIIAATGTRTTQIATVGLGELIGMKMVILGNIFAIFAMFTSFISLAYALKEMFRCDCNFDNIPSLTITCFVPFLIFLLIRNFADFIDVLGITGALFGGMDGILIVLMYWRAKNLAKRKPEYSLRNHYVIGSLIMLIFVTGLVLTILGLFN